MGNNIKLISDSLEELESELIAQDNACTSDSVKGARSEFIDSLANCSEAERVQKAFMAIIELKKRIIQAIEKNPNSESLKTIHEMNGLIDKLAATIADPTFGPDGFDALFEEKPSAEQDSSTIAKTQPLGELAMFTDNGYVDTGALKRNVYSALCELGLKRICDDLAKDAPSVIEKVNSGMEFCRLCHQIVTDGSLNVSNREAALKEIRDSFSNSVENGLEAKASVERVIELMTVFLNSLTGREVFKNANIEEIFNLSSPIVVIGLMLSKSKQGLYDKARVEILEEVIATQSEDDLLALFEKCEELENETGIPQFAKSVIREVLRHALKEGFDLSQLSITPDDDHLRTDISEDPYAEIQSIRGLMMEDHLDPSQIVSNFDESVQGVISAIKTFDNDLYLDLMEEMIGLHFWSKQDGNESKRPVVISNTSEFEAAVKDLCGDKPINISKPIAKELKRLEASATTKVDPQKAITSDVATSGVPEDDSEFAGYGDDIDDEI